MNDLGNWVMFMAIFSFCLCLTSCEEASGTDAPRVEVHLTDDSGVFLLRGVPAGDYDVLFSPSDTLLLEQTISDVNVMLNQNGDIGTITLQ